MTIVSEILLAVLNSLWQAAVVAGLVWLALHFARGINAATRYAIWWAVLAVIVALPVAPRVIAWSRAQAERSPAAAETPRTAPRLKQPLIEEQPAIVTLPQERVSRWPLWIAGLWAALCLFRLWQIGRSYFYLRGVKRRAEVAPEDIARQPLDAASRRARLLLSTDVASPMAVGFLHPAVILPESLPGELEQAEMEHVLLHEAAHIARNDDWSNLLARLAGAALALHPVAWWILRQIEREREIACDDWVVARVGSARPYARSLARMSELRWSKARAANRGEALASGIFGGGSRLGERIELLLTGSEFSTRMSRIWLAASTLALVAGLTGSAVAPRMVVLAQSRFEVVSIRPYDPSHVFAEPMMVGPERFSATNVPLFYLIEQAYGVREFQVSGAPDWARSDRFMVQAKVDGSASEAAVWRLVQAMLADRFKLKLHRETREMFAYELTVARSGPKMALHKDELTCGFGKGCIQVGGGLLWARGTTPENLAATLTILTGEPVLDKTGLSGNFDFKFPYDESSVSASAGLSRDPTEGASIFVALEEQLGLKLEAKKREPVEVLVIDRAEKPGEN